MKVAIFDAVIFPRFEGDILFEHRERGTSIGLCIALALVPVMIAGLGCSKDEMKQAYEDAKSKTQELATSTVQVVEEHLPPSGNITLRSSSPIDPTSSATLELISIGDGRPNVLQVTSYDPAVSARSYPSILLHGTTDASTVESVAGSKFECDFYLRASSNSAIAMNSPAGRATVVFSSLNSEDQTITATIAPIELMGADGKPVQIHGGDLVAVISQGGR